MGSQKGHVYLTLNILSSGDRWATGQNYVRYVGLVGTGLACMSASISQRKQFVIRPWSTFSLTAHENIGSYQIFSSGTRNNIHSSLTIAPKHRKWAL